MYRFARQLVQCVSVAPHLRGSVACLSTTTASTMRRYSLVASWRSSARSSVVNHGILHPRAQYLGSGVVVAHASSSTNASSSPSRRSSISQSTQRLIEPIKGKGARKEAAASSTSTSKKSTSSSSSTRGARSKSSSGTAPRLGKVQQFQQAFKQAAEANDLAKAMALFQSLRDKHVKPDIFMFDQVLAICSRHQAWARAWSLYQQIKKRALAPTVSTYGALWNCAAEVVEAGMARVHRVMRSAHSTDEQRRHAQAERTHLYSNARERAQYLRREMRKYRVAPNILVANTMLKLAKAMEDEAQALAIIDVLTSMDPSSTNTSSSSSGHRAERPTRSLYDLLLLDLDPDSSIPLLQRQEELSNDEAAEAAPGSTAASLLSDDEDWSDEDDNDDDQEDDDNHRSKRKAAAKVEVPAPESQGADLVTFTTMLSMVGKDRSGGLEKALEIWQSARASGLRVDLRFYNALLGVCKVHQSESTAVEVLQEMLAVSRVLPDKYTITLLASIFLKAKRSTMAPELLHLALGITSNDSPLVARFYQQLAQFNRSQQGDSGAASSTRKRKPAVVLPEIRVLDSTEVNALLALATCRKYWRVPPRLYALFYPPGATTLPTTPAASTTTLPTLGDAPEQRMVDDQQFVKLLTQICAMQQIELSDYCSAALAIFYARKKQPREALQYLRLDKLADSRYTALLEYKSMEMLAKQLKNAQMPMQLLEWLSTNKPDADDDAERVQRQRRKDAATKKSSTAKSSTATTIKKTSSKPKRSTE